MQQPETKHDDSKPHMKVKTSGLSPSSSSPSSSESSLELSSSQKDNEASSYSPDMPNQTPQWSMISASPRGEEAPSFPEWNEANPSMMKSPPMPNMGHPPGYDPNRIPSSIFSSKPNNGMNWSTASNESLFSIHMGNNSFSRDQFNMMYRSGELIKPEEWSNSPYNAPEVKSNEKKNLPPNPNLPPLVEVATDKEVKSETILESPRMQEKIVESPKIVPMENQDHENNIKEKKTSNVDEVPHSPSTPNKSYGKVVPLRHFMLPRPAFPMSGNSSSSFAFPVLLNDAGKTGSLKAPSAKWRYLNLKPEMQPQSPQKSHPQSPQRSQPYSKPESKQPESQPKLAATTWFSCFSCWPRCC